MEKIIKVPITKIKFRRIEMRKKEKSTKINVKMHHLNETEKSSYYLSG